MFRWGSHQIEGIHLVRKLTSPACEKYPLVIEYAISSSVTLHKNPAIFWRNHKMQTLNAGGSALTNGPPLVYDR